MRLFVDDIRPCPDGWELARSNTKAIRILATMPIEEISIDHDIACYIWSGQSHTSNETFMPVAFYIAAMPEELRPKTVYIHTANPIGADNIKSVLEGKVENIIRDTTFAEPQMKMKDWETWEDKRNRAE